MYQNHEKPTVFYSNGYSGIIVSLLANAWGDAIWRQMADYPVSGINCPRKFVWSVDLVTVKLL